MREDIERLVEDGYRRNHLIKVVNRETNATKALIRRILGWSPDLEDKAAEAVKTRAGRIVEAHLKGKPQKDDDEAIAESVAAELMLLSTIVEPANKRRSEVEKGMEKAARNLPGHDFVTGVRGFGDRGFAMIISMTGALDNYPHPDKVRKRLGLAPFTVDGGLTKAPSTWRKSGGLSADDWTEVGYKPSRLGDVFGCVTDPLFRAQWQGAREGVREAGPIGLYGEVYARRRARTAETHPDWTKGHAHADALRVMTSRLIEDLWRAWNADVKAALGHRPAAGAAHETHAAA